MCFNAFKTLATYGTEDEQKTVVEIVQAHMDDILDSMQQAHGRAYQFIPFLDTALALNVKTISKQISEKLRVYLQRFPDDYQAIVYCLLSNYEAIRMSGEVALAGKIAPYGLSIKKTIAAWIAGSGGSELSVVSDIYNHLYAMEVIENKRHGIVKFLNVKFGIFDFGRYPEELLIQQYDEFENKNLPYGVLLYPYADHNGAFARRQPIFRSLIEQLQGSYLLRVGEGESKLDVARLLRRMNRQYGKEHKISFAIIGGHGTKDSIQFGDKPDERCYLRTEDLKDPRANKMSYFEPRPTIILVSCSTGFENGIGQELSQLMGATVIAPKVDTSIKAIETRIDDAGIHFGVQYIDEKSEAVYSAGQKKV